MNLRAFEFHIAETITNIRRNGFAAFAAVINCALSLAVLGVFILGAWNVREKAREIASNVQIVIHMRRDIDLDTTQRLADELQSRYANHIQALEVISAEEAWRRFLDDNPDIAKEIEDRENPLGPAIYVQVVEPEDHVPIVELAKQDPNVDEVVYAGEVLDALARFKELGRWIALAMLTVLTIASMLTIANTIRLTIHARRKEISIMEMVGATSAFIKTPFVLEGMFDGFVGALIGCALLLPAYMEVAELLDSNIPAIAPTVASPEQLAIVGGALVVAGLLFGFVGSYIAVQRYLSI